MLPKLNPNDCGFMLVEQAFDWSKGPTQWLSIADICRTAGFEPTPGDCVSVSRYLQRRGIRRIKQRAQRGALMPPRLTA